MPLNLKIIIASTRPVRVGPTIAAWITDFAKTQTAFEVDLIDLAELALPLLNEPAHPSARNYQHAHTLRWSEIVDSADAFVFVTPEYDYFAPASLVNAVQYLFHEWDKKPAGVVCYGGVSGGLRSAQVVRQLLSNMGMVALNRPVPIPFFPNFIKDGVFQPDEPIMQGATAMLADLQHWATVLKSMRSGASQEHTSTQP